MKIGAADIATDCRTNVVVENSSSSQRREEISSNCTVQSFVVTTCLTIKIEDERKIEEEMEDSSKWFVN